MNNLVLNFSFFPKQPEATANNQTCYKAKYNLNEKSTDK